MAEKKVFRRYFVSVLVFLVMLILAYAFYQQTSDVTMSLLIVFGFFLGLMDTAIGMGYGTLGTPVLLIFGVSSKIAVPAILISQFVGAACGSISHKKYKNVDVLNFKGRDGKIAFGMVGLGIIGALVGVIAAIKLPSIYVSTYIGLLVTVIGVVLILKPKSTFSWAKFTVISIVSGFNKAISGGGYGPVSTGGLLIAGHDTKKAIGTTVFAVAIINLFSFGVYLLSHSVTTYAVMLALSIGALLGSILGPRITKDVEMKRDTNIMGAAVLILGILTIITTFVKF